MSYKKIYIRPLYAEPSDPQRDCTTQKTAQTSGRRRENKTVSSSKQNQGSLINSKQSSMRKGVLKRTTEGDARSRQRQTGGDLLVKEYHQNEAKIQKATVKLDELFTHYQSQRVKLVKMKEGVKEKDRLRHENKSIELQISRIKDMLKEVLLARQKTKLTARQKS